MSGRVDLPAVGEERSSGRALDARRTVRDAESRRNRLESTTDGADGVVDPLRAAARDEDAAASAVEAVEYETIV